MRRWKVYSAILLVPLLGGTAARLLRVIVAFTLRDLGVSIFDITLLSSSFMLSRAFLSPVVGKFADRGMKRYAMIMVGFSGLLVDSQLYLLLPYEGILALRIMDGVWSAMIWPTMQAIVHFSAPDNLKARVMSLYFVMGSVGMSLGYIAYSYTVSNIYYALYLILLIYIVEIIASTVFREVEGERKKVERRAGNINASLFALTFGFGFYLSLGNEVLLFYLAENMGMGRVNASLALFTAAMIALAGSLMLGHVADRRGFTFALLLLGIVAPIASLFIAIDNLYLALFGVFLFFISARGFMPISRSFTASASRNIGTSLGFVNLASNLGSVVGPPIGGFLMDLFGFKKIGIFNMSAMIFVVTGAFILVISLLFQRSQSPRDDGK